MYIGGGHLGTVTHINQSTESTDGGVVVGVCVGGGGGGGRNGGKQGYHECYFVYL